MANSFSIIVMYTFSDKAKRQSFRDKLKEMYKTERLDESVYALKGQYNVKIVNDELRALCKEIKLEETSSISMYYCQSLIDPFAYNDIRIRMRIKREQVWGNTKKRTSK